MTVERTGENALPGADLVAQGLTDLAAGNESVPALLVSIGASKLRTCGINVPATIDEPNQRLYRLLQHSYGDAAHSRYNALIRRLVSYERALQSVRAFREAVIARIAAIATTKPSKRAR